MAKRSALARSASTRMPRQDSGNVKAEPGESRIQEPTVTEWDPHASDLQEKPDDRTVPAIDDAQVGRPQATPPADEADKQARIRKLLSNDAPDEEPAEDPAPAAEQPKPVAEPAKPPARRDILANLGAEKQKRQLEQQLKAERERADKAEKDRDEASKLLKDGDLLSFAKARGLTTDQAIDMLMNPPAEPAKPPPAPAADQTNERLSRLEQRERDLLQREAMARLEEETKELDIPVTRATSRVAVTDNKGGSRIMSGRELVLATAQRLWEADGRPAGKQREYIKEAAPLVEQQLIDDDKDRFEAYAKKTGGGTPAAAPKPAPAKKPAVPSVGSRSGGSSPKQEVPELPDDPDERRLAIKQRLGWS